MREKEIWQGSQSKVVFVNEMLDQQNLKFYFRAVYVLKKKKQKQTKPNNPKHKTKPKPYLLHSVWPEMSL